MKYIKTYEETSYPKKSKDYTEFTLRDVWNSVEVFNEKTQEVEWWISNAKYEVEIKKLLKNKHISYTCGIREHKNEIRKGDVEEIEFGYIDLGDHDDVETFIKFQNDENYMEHPVAVNEPIRIWHLESLAKSYNL